MVEGPAAPTSNNQPARHVRRRQEDRTREMRQRLLNATLECLSDVGYAGLSISRVAKAAQVSRGAILHHFATKLELAAAAMRHFQQLRRERLASLIEANAASGISVDEKLDAVRKEVSTSFSVNMEIVNALRTNAELSALVLRGEAVPIGQPVAGHAGPSCKPTGDDPDTLVAVIVAFVRGMCVEAMPGAGSDHHADRMFEIFRAMVHAHVSNRTSCATNVPGLASGT